MFQWLESLSILEKIFTSLAALGGFLFGIRVVMMFVGIGDDADHGDTDGGDVDGDADHGDHGDAVDSHAGADTMMSFTLLSFQGLTGFFMMFGLVGLALSRGNSGNITSMIGGTVAGLATVWIVDKLFRFFNRMQSSGTLNLRNAIHEEGTIYLTIPAEETGKVRINVQGRLKVLSAISEDRTEIATDARVRVVNVVNENILVVKKV